jgi:hypothetical protein
MKARITRGLAIGALCALVSATVTLAGITPISIKDWEQNQQVNFSWKDGGVPPEWMKNAVKGAAADSTRSRGAKSAVLAYKAGAVSWVYYGPDLPTAAALAYASRNAPNSFKVWFRVHGHMYDWGQLRWCQFFANPPNGCFDAQTAALHEFGHVQGLGHSGDGPADTIMYTTSLTKPKAGFNARDFGRCDVAAMQTRYEALTPSTPISTCLNLATQLALTSSAAIAPSGTPVTFTASLKIGDGVAHARLAGDPLSDRAVVLQRRLVGAASWTVQGAMASGAGAGSYRTTLTPGGTYEWRAVFAKPADEGLKASNSAVVKVSVTSSSSGDGSCTPTYCRESLED